MDETNAQLIDMALNSQAGTEQDLSAGGTAQTTSINDLRAFEKMNFTSNLSSVEDRANTGEDVVIKNTNLVEMHGVVPAFV